jgi:glycosyltransferase involved in cell wall biosynthesis
MNWPKITIVTENLNHGEFLEAMIQSALSQNYPNLEYIVIDGGSKDRSVEIIRKYESRIAYWCSEKDNGLFDACNKGFARSTGEIMAFVGSDDMLLPGSLHTVGSIMAQLPEVEWLTTLNPAEWDYHGALSPTAPVRGFCREAFLEGYYAARRDKERAFYHEFGWIQSESTFWRRSLWEKTGGRFRAEHFRYAADFDLWSRFFLHADLYATPCMLAGWRRRAGLTATRGNHYAD